MIKTLSYAVTGQRIETTETAMLVAGTVNVYTARFAFDEAWDGLQRTAVFAGDGITREQLLEDDACTVPWEVLVAGYYLRVGVYGTKADGTRLPTIWTERRLYINPGACPTQEAADPSPTLVEQLLGRIGDPANLKTEDKSSLVAAINEVCSSGGSAPYIGANGNWYVGQEDSGIPATGPSGSDGADGQDGVGIQSVEQTTTSTEDGGTNVITVTKTDGTSSTFAVRNGSKGSTGPAGANGKSAYQYAKDGGYTGTEAEFAAKLAAEIPAVDDTLKEAGKAADAAAVGDALSSLSEEIENIPGGQDGVTPTIGDNGNWYLGDTDTGKPSRGATGAKGDPGTPGAAGPAGAPGKDGAGMDITGATIGQIAKITAVDASGVPTAWSPVDMPGGGESTFEKLVEMTTLEDAAVISISTDKNGNPLSMSEFYVAITTARNSASTANNHFNCNVLPDTVPSYIRAASAIKNLTLFQDVYCYVMHYKVVGGMIFHEYASRARTSSGLNVAKYLENEKTIGISVGSGETTGFLSPSDASNGESKIDSAGKMYCITFGADSTECIFGAGTRVEVWAR